MMRGGRPSSNNEARRERPGRGPERGLRPRHHDHVGDVRQLRNDPGAGTLLVHAHGMGTVMRCPSCNGVGLRVARTPARLCLDPRGARLIVMTGTTTPLSA